MDVQATGQPQVAPNSTDPTLPEIMPGQLHCWGPCSTTRDSVSLLPLSFLPFPSLLLSLPPFPSVKQSAVMEAPLPASEQPPPDLFLASDETAADKPSPTAATREADSDRKTGREDGDASGGVAVPLPEGVTETVEGGMQQVAALCRVWCAGMMAVVCSFFSGE